MANSRATDDYYEYATVHQEPAGDGYFTNAVGIRQLKGREYIFFSIRDTDISSAGGAGSMRVTLQFKCPGDDDWTDYDVYTDVCRKVLEGGAAGVTWRAGVKVDTTQMEIELFFEQKTNIQRAVDINTKLDSLILILEAKKDTTNGNNRR